MSDNIPATTAPSASNSNLPAETPQQTGVTINTITEQISNSTLAPLVIGGAAIITALIALFFWASAPTFKPLYSNISESDGGAIIAELEKRGVPYEFDANGRTIKVPNEEVHKLRLQLAEQGIPEGGDNGFEIMDDQKFGISQFTEQVNFQRALEGELAQSIQALGPVAKARIHLAIAKPSVFARQQEPSKASVVLTLHPGRTLTKAQANAVAHMISSSIPELQSSDVSIVDQSGNLIEHGNGSDETINTNRLEYVQTVEEKIQKRVERILLPIFGPNNFRVQIAAEIDFTAQEETAEQFKPNQGQETTAAIRSAQTRAKANDTNTDIGGFAGALSNTPPGWMQSPVDNGPNGGAGRGGRNTNLETQDLDYANTVNYEIDRSIIHTRRQPGTVTRLTAAVVVNHRDAFTPEGELIKEAIPQAELDQIEALIRQSIGFSEIRGDRLQLVNTLFAKSNDDEEVVVEWFERPEMIGLIESGMRYLFAFIAAMILYFTFLRPLLKRHREAQEKKEEALRIEKGLDEEGNSVVGDVTSMGNEIAFDADGNFKVSTIDNEYAQSYQTALDEAKNLSENDPQVVALAIKDWMTK